MELTNFSTFWLQNTTFPLKYGKYICTQSCIFRSKIEKTKSTQSFVVGSQDLPCADTQQSSRKKHLRFNRVGHVRYYGESNYLICQPLEPTTKLMELTNFFTFWLQNTTFLLKYGKYICIQSCIFRSKIEKTTQGPEFCYRFLTDNFYIMLASF